MSIRESGEMYLESIYMLLNKSNRVRAIDVAEYTGYSKPSVSRALSLLRESGHILTDADGYLTLTEKGNALAQKTYERHEVLTKCFMLLGVCEETASADACRIEHVISDETFNAMKKHLVDMDK
jgi:Mn-dependent DtxR family transcriptional regulator